MREWLKITPEQLNKEVPGMIIWRYGNALALPGTIIGIGLMVVGAIAMCVASPWWLIDVLVVLFTLSALNHQRLGFSQLWRYRKIKRTAWGSVIAQLIKELGDRSAEFVADDTVPGTPLFTDWEERLNQVWRRANLDLGLVITEFTPQ